MSYLIVFAWLHLPSFYNHGPINVVSLKESASVIIILYHFYLVNQMVDFTPCVSTLFRDDKYLQLRFVYKIGLNFIYKKKTALNEIHSKTGNGGNAGRQSINVRRVRGKVDLKTCRGTGGAAASNGAGGAGEYTCIRHHRDENSQEKQN